VGRREKKIHSGSLAPGGGAGEKKYFTPLKRRERKDIREEGGMDNAFLKSRAKTHLTRERKRGVAGKAREGKK